MVWFQPDCEIPIARFGPVLALCRHQAIRRGGLVVEPANGPMFYALTSGDSTLSIMCLEAFAWKESGQMAYTEKRL